MGLTRAAGWTLLGMLGAAVTYTLFPSLPDVFHIWILVFAYPGFLAGVGFSLVLRLMKGRRRDEAAWNPGTSHPAGVGGALILHFRREPAFL